MSLTLSTLNLSHQVQSTSAAVAKLKIALGSQAVAPQTFHCLQALHAEIDALTQILGFKGHGPGAQGPPSSRITQLAEMALTTLWDEIPLHSLADAHKHRAEELMRDGKNDEAVYMECVKYLHLHPTKDGPDFIQMKKRVRNLERHLSARY